MEPRIRTVKTDDAAAMLAIYGKVILETTISWEYEVPKVAEFESRIKKVLGGGHPWIVLEDEAGNLAGYAYASDFRGRYGYRFCCESTIYLRQDVRGKGWGKLLYGVLIEILLAQGYVAVIGGLAYPNPPSEALHRSLGFELVGINERIGYKFGEWLNVCFMQKNLSSRVEPVAEKPARFDEMLAAGAFADLLS